MNELLAGLALRLAARSGSAAALVAASGRRQPRRRRPRAWRRLAAAAVVAAAAGDGARRRRLPRRRGVARRPRRSTATTAAAGHGGGYHGGALLRRPAATTARGYYRPTRSAGGWGGGLGLGLGWGWGYRRLGGWGSRAGAIPATATAATGYGYGAPGGYVGDLVGDRRLGRSVDDRRFARGSARLPRRPLHRHGRRLRRLSRLPLPEARATTSSSSSSTASRRRVDRRRRARRAPRSKINNKLKKIPGAKQYGSYDTPEPEGGVQRYFGARKARPIHPVNADDPGLRSRQGRSRLARNGYRRSLGSPPRAISARPASGSEARDGSRAAGARRASPAARPGSIVSRRAAATPRSTSTIASSGTGEELSTLTRGLPGRAGPAHGSWSRGRAMATASDPGGRRAGRSETVEISLQRQRALRAECRVRTCALTRRISHILNALEGIDWGGGGLGGVCHPSLPHLPSVR